MKIRQIFLCIGLQFSFIGCFCQKKSRLELSKKYSLSIDLISDWNKDKHGCLSLRMRYVDTIRANKNLIGMSKEDLRILFGKPDSITENWLKYFTGAECDYKNNVDLNADNAWVVFYFRDNKLTVCGAFIQ